MQVNRTCNAKNIMIKVTITSTDVRNMKGLGKVSQKPYDLNFQTMYVHTVDKMGNTNPYPEKTEIILDKDPNSGAALFYPAGEYVLSPASIQIDRMGNLDLRPVLYAARNGAK
jgi:hypothetical protein